MLSRVGDDHHSSIAPLLDFISVHLFCCSLASSKFGAKTRPSGWGALCARRPSAEPKAASSLAAGRLTRARARALPSALVRFALAAQAASQLDDNDKLFSTVALMIGGRENTTTPPPPPPLMIGANFSSCSGLSLACEGVASLRPARRQAPKCWAKSSKASGAAPLV